MPVALTSFVIARNATKNRCCEFYAPVRRAQKKGGKDVPDVGLAVISAICMMELNQ